MLCNSLINYYAPFCVRNHNDCSHTQEQGCAILAALKDGMISQERYQNFIKLNKESAFYEMSYLEKKRKDKKFGKFVKSVMKDKKHKD